MRKITVLLFLFVSLLSTAQISVGPVHLGNSKKFEKGQIESFKKTTTIFVLNSTYSVKEYENILKEIWTVTPFKVVDEKEFSIGDYLKGNYSFFRIKGFVRTTTLSSGRSTTSLFINLDLDMYDTEVILEKLVKLKKVSEKKRQRKFEDLLGSNIQRLAQVSLYPKDEFTDEAVYGGKEKAIESMYTDDIFFNYDLGLLKNYFQKINKLLLNEQIYWLYESDYQLELQELVSNKLFVPSYLGVKYNGWSGKDSDQKDENIGDVFKRYKYDYNIIDKEELSNKILKGEDFYYIRYSRRNAERFLNIVNAKTGEVIYRDYMVGFLSYKIKPKHIDDINSKIGKIIKKASKNK